MELNEKTKGNFADTSEDMALNNTINHRERNKDVQLFITQLFNKININKKIENNEVNNADKELNNENNEINNTDNENKLNNFNNLKQELEIVYVIDRFEENYAVCENRETKEMSNINIYDLPKNVKEGDVLRYKNGEYFLDNDSRQIIEKQIQEKTKNIFED